MQKRAPYFHVYLGLMVVFASYAMGGTMRVREARVEKKAFVTSGVCSVSVLSIQRPKPRVETENRDISRNGMRVIHHGNRNGFIGGTTGFLIENGKVLIHCDWNLISRISDAENWENHLSARFPGLAKPFTLKIEKYSKKNCVALCSFTQPDDVEIPNPLLAGIAPMPSDGQRLLFVGYPVNEETREVSFRSSPLTAPAVAEKFYPADKTNRGVSLISLDYKDWYKVGLGALVLDERQQIVGILSVGPPGDCGIRDRYIFPFDDVLRNLEGVADPFETRDSSSAASSGVSSSAR